MNKEKSQKLAANGWEITTVQDFLELTPEEMAYIELKIALGRKLRVFRKQSKLSQSKFAQCIGTSQSRVAKMEKGDPSVSIDLLVKSLFALDKSSLDKVRSDLDQIFEVNQKELAAIS